MCFKVMVFFHSGGAGRTGVLIALNNLIERVKEEHVIDVYQTIKRMRQQRTAMVQTKVCESYFLKFYPMGVLSFLSAS